MLSSWEVIIAFAVLLLLFGSRLPQIAQSIGRSIQSFKKGLSEIDINGADTPDRARDVPVKTVDAPEQDNGKPKSS